MSKSELWPTSPSSRIPVIRPVRPESPLSDARLSEMGWLREVGIKVFVELALWNSKLEIENETGGGVFEMKFSVVFLVGFLPYGDGVPTCG